MNVFGRREREWVPHPGCHIGARVRNTRPGDFHVDTGEVIDVAGTHDVSVQWDDESSPDPSGRTWWTLGKDVEHIPGT